MLKRRIKKIGIAALTAAMTTTALAGCSPSGTDGETIEIGFVNWAECIAVTNIWKNILEDEGYNVELTQLDVTPLFVGMAGGDIDLFLDAWLPVTHGNLWAEYQDDLYDAGNWYESPAKIGIVVPSYVTIDSLAEYGAVADQFDNEIIGIEPGGGEMIITRDAIEQYEMDATLVDGSEAAKMTALNRAYEDNEWIAITGWSPHWMFASYDLKYLEDPLGLYGGAEECHSVFNADYAAENPEVVAMLEAFSMSDNQIGTVEKLINDGADPADAAAQWILENQDIVDSWLGK